MSSNAQQIPTISSSVGVKPNEVELTIIQHERKHRIYLITIVLLVVTSLLLIAAIAAIVVTFLVDKPAKQASNNTIVDSPIFSSSNCSYGFSGSYCDECGVTFAAPNVKIVGGIAATRNSWPAHAVVIFTFKSDVFLADKQVTYKLDRTYLCGGTLINRRTILTAAHCIQKTIEFEYQSETYTVNVTPNNYFPTIESMFSVYLGVDQFGKNSSGAKFSVSYIKRHDDYNVNSNLNDIAIIQLSSEAKLSQSIQVACLPSPEKGLYPTTSGMDVWAMGFGALNSDGPSPDTLYNVKMTLYDGATQCRRVAPRTPKNWDSQICAGELKGGKDTCQGDSGGAIYVKDEVNNSTKYIAVGITSYGVGCALPNSPGIYTRISYYLNWINQYS